MKLPKGKLGLRTDSRETENKYVFKRDLKVSVTIASTNCLVGKNL